MSSWLGIASTGRSRSKSPGGQDRDRSRTRSNVEDRAPDKDRRSNGGSRRGQKYSDTESSTDSEEDSRRREKRSSKKTYDPPSSDDDRRHRKSSSKKHVDSDSEPDRHRSKPKKDDRYAAKRRDASDSEDDRRRRRREREAEEDKRKSNTKSTRKKSDSDSESDRRRERRRRASKDESSGQEDISIVIQRKSKSKKDDEKATTPRTSATAVTSPSVPTVPSYAQPAGFAYPQPGYAPQPPGAFQQEPLARHMSYVNQDPRYAPPPPAGAYVSPTSPQAEVPYRPRAASNVGSAPQYADVGQFRYAQVDPSVAYKYDNRAQPPVSSYDPRTGQPYVRQESFNRDKKYYEDQYERDAKARETKRERRPSTLEAQKPSRRLSSTGFGASLGASLGVAAAAHGPSNGHGKPPASPLLEAYKGTYQSISPMPSALVLSEHRNDSDLSDFDLSSDSDIPDGPNADLKRKIRKLEKERELSKKQAEHAQKVEQRRKELERKHSSDKPAYETRAPDSDISSMMVGAEIVRSPIGGKKVSFYDGEDDAKAIAAALKGTHKAPNVKPLIKILPHLTVDDLDALKVEYKKHAKIDGVGINLSKHIKTRVTGHIGKAAYACSLGQWESEGYWANCYYQAGASRRELLIESLMGRTNQQIREIKNFFKDKKYDDDLGKCMRTELKADKFRSAILLALEERRQPESPLPDVRLVKQDVQDLYQALNSAGGETAMIEIIVVRSDTHLREVLRVYERVYGKNFARDMINKSRNLVGETLAHILNGALNRPMRDALLLHQAIAETAPGKERAELLISRLIRLHWEPKHLQKVKAQYHSKYGLRVEDTIKKEIQSQMKTEEGLAWTNFCIELAKSSDD